MSAVKPEIVRLSSKGQLVIPRAIREQLHWEPGMELTVVPAGRGIMIQPKPRKGKHRLEDLIGFLNYEGPPISDEALFAPVDYEESGDGGESEKGSQ